MQFGPGQWLVIKNFIEVIDKILTWAVVLMIAICEC